MFENLVIEYPNTLYIKNKWINIRKMDLPKDTKEYKRKIITKFSEYNEITKQIEINIKNESSNEIMNNINNINAEENINLEYNEINSIINLENTKINIKPEQKRKTAFILKLEQSEEELNELKKLINEDTRINTKEFAEENVIIENGVNRKINWIYIKFKTPLIFPYKNYTKYLYFPKGINKKNLKDWVLAKK